MFGMVVSQVDNDAFVLLKLVLQTALSLCLY